jgi:hypothetical protein
MKINFDLAHNIVVHCDAHEVEGHIEIENIEIEMISNTGWNHWAVPRDQTEIEILKDDLMAKFREVKEAGGYDDDRDEDVAWATASSHTLPREQLNISRQQQLDLF